MIILKRIIERQDEVVWVQGRDLWRALVNLSVP
jgi:hypothetical protein